MATGKIKTLFSDKEKTEILYPKTKVNAISDNDGKGLDALLENLPYFSDADYSDVATIPANADTLGGVPAKNYATQAFVTNKIAEAQLSGGEGGDIDLSGYATKDDLNDINNKLGDTPVSTQITNAINEIDYPVDSVNGKTGAVSLSASDVGAVPISGGTLNGSLNVGGKVGLWTDTEGGNIRLNSPDDTTTDYWEMDSSDGDKFRIFAYKNATHPNGAGFIIPLYVYSDGSIGVDNTSKTIERLGITANAIGARSNTWLPSPAEIGAVAAARTNLANMSVRDWAVSLTTIGTSYAITNNTTTDMPENLSGYNGYALVTATVGAVGGWVVLRATSILTGYSAICIYNYGWSEWKSANALASHEHGSSLPAIRPAGSIFFKKV